MNDKIFFSIIMPAYNVGKFLNDAINSLLKQTFTNFEVLIMVEKSSDKSLEIAQDIARKDKRFLATSLDKSGSASISRNSGMKMAKGEYIIFIDGDDWIELDALENIYKKIKSNENVDIVMFAANEYYQWQSGERNYRKKLQNLTEKDCPHTVNGIEMMSIISKLNKAPLIAVWLNAYRRKYLLDNKIFFAEKLRYEDNEWTFRAWYYARKIVVIDNICYLYRKRQGSVTTAMDENSIFEFIDILLLMNNFYIKNPMPQPVKRLFSSNYLSLLYWYLFNDNYYNLFSKSDRYEALNILLNRQGIWNFFKMAISARKSRVVGVLPVLMFYWTKIEFFPIFYFQKIYYPLTKLKFRS